MVIRLETETGSASHETPGLHRKEHHAPSTSSLFPRSGPCQGHRHGRKPLLHSSATCHTVVTALTAALNPSHNSPNRPGVSHTQSFSLCSLHFKNLSTHQSFSHHIYANTPGHKYCKVQYYPTVFKPTCLPALQR